MPFLATPVGHIRARPTQVSRLKWIPHRALALHLLKAGQLTLVQAAKLADMALEDFMDLVSKASIVVVDYPPEELEQELNIAQPQ